MNLSKSLTYIALLLFGTIAVAGYFKGDTKPQPIPEIEIPNAVEIPLGKQITQAATPTPKEHKRTLPTDLPDANRIEQLFNTYGNKLPIVETVTYKSRVPWRRGRPAWIVDYATHYDTSRHFIARSLNGAPDYLKQDVSNGDKFNVLKRDKDLSFHLVVDLSRAKLWFYYHDADSDERVLLKTYDVGLGRADATKPSGFLTPLGQYSLGKRVAIYSPKVMGHHNGERIEMINVFGTRWIPFEAEIKGCTAPPKGFGLHGTSWVFDHTKRKYAEERESVGDYVSDGCIRLATEDIEEVYAIIVTKPSFIHLVRDFGEAELPGVEVEL